MERLDQKAMNAYARTPEGRAYLTEELAAARDRSLRIRDLIETAQTRKTCTDDLIRMLEIAVSQPEIEP